MDENEIERLKTKVRLLSTKQVREIIYELEAERALRLAETRALEKAAECITKITTADVDGILCPHSFGENEPMSAGKSWCDWDSGHCSGVPVDCLLKYFREAKKEEG